MIRCHHCTEPLDPRTGPVTLRATDHALDPEDFPSLSAALARTRHLLWWRQPWVIYVGDHHYHRRTP